MLSFLVSPRQYYRTWKLRIEGFYSFFLQVGDWSSGLRRKCRLELKWICKWNEWGIEFPFACCFFAFSLLSYICLFFFFFLLSVLFFSFRAGSEKVNWIRKNTLRRSNFQDTYNLAPRTCSRRRSRMHWQKEIHMIQVIHTEIRKISMSTNGIGMGYLLSFLYLTCLSIYLQLHSFILSSSVNGKNTLLRHNIARIAGISRSKFIFHTHLEYENWIR